MVPQEDPLPCHAFSLLLSSVTQPHTVSAYASLPVQRGVGASGDGCTTEARDVAVSRTDLALTRRRLLEAPRAAATIYTPCLCPLTCAIKWHLQSTHPTTLPPPPSHRYRP